MESLLDPNKYLEGMIRNQLLKREQEIKDREAKLYKLEKELLERKMGHNSGKTERPL